MAGILFEKTESIGKITLNRPEVFNSFNREMGRALQEALDRCKDDPEVRAIFLTGTGRAFCAGQDLQEVTGPGSPPLDTIVAQTYNPIIRRLREIEKPVVCAVNGVAAGAGANIAVACDITVATESASFVQAFSKIGLIPDSGGTYFLPRIVGRQRATALMMLSEKLTARQAEEMGLIYKAFPDAEFASLAWQIAQTLAQMPTAALGLTKRALNLSLTNDLPTQLAVEEELQTAAADTYDYKEGVQAFLEKRRPVFKGY
jgi:2-(1,2-epoxy-1,2-dihydrophenyl)acetyl-CoA isomerase